MGRRNLLTCSVEEYGSDLSDNPAQMGNADQWLDELDLFETTSANINHNLQDIDQIRENGLGIERLLETFKSYKDLPDKTFVQIALNHHLNNIGVEAMMVDFNTLSNEEIEAALEGFLDKIYNGIIDISLKTFKVLEDFFKNLYSGAIGISAQAEALSVAVRGLRGKEAKHNTLFIRDGHKLHVGGHCEMKSILTGYSNLTKANETVWPSYLDNLYKFYKEYIATWQGMVRDFDIMERHMTVSGVIGKFVERTDVDLQKVLNVGDQNLELSGGKVFKARTIVQKGLPHLDDKTKGVKVESRQEVRVPTPEEMQHLLSMVEENMNTIKTSWGKYKTLSALVIKARKEVSNETSKKRENSLLKYISRFGASVDLRSIYYPTLIRPINELGKHTVSVSRSILVLCERSIKEYE